MRSESKALVAQEVAPTKWHQRCAIVMAVKEESVKGEGGEIRFIRMNVAETDRLGHGVYTVAATVVLS